MRGGADAPLRTHRKEKEYDLLGKILEGENKMSEWISVFDRLPEPKCEVLVLVDRSGDKVVTTAMYNGGRMPIEDSVWSWRDLDFGYDEENDKYLVPEGWWEYRHCINSEVQIDGFITHWMPLPPPKEEAT